MTNLSKNTKSNLDIFSLSSDIASINKPYSAITKDIQVTIWPEFIDTKISAAGNLFIWAYHVRIDNNSSKDITLTNRYWKIIDEKGLVQEVSGEGVIGEKPTIKIGKSYQYSSGVHLTNPSGVMMGTYQMQEIDGENFSVKIPSFSLDIPNSKSSIN